MKRIRAARFWLLAFAGSYLVWLVHDDSGKLPELLAGLVVAALAATGTELVRRQRVAQMNFRARSLRKAWRLVPGAVRDSFALTQLVVAQLLRPQAARGRTVAMPFAGPHDDPDTHARRAVAAGLGSFAPGTLVIGIDPEAQVVIVHQLGAQPQPSTIDPLELG